MTAILRGTSVYNNYVLTHLQERVSVSPLFCRISLVTPLPPHMSPALAERLPELNQPIGLLVPKQLPELPSIPLELLPSVCTQLNVRYIGPRQVPVRDYETAKAWWGTTLHLQALDEFDGRKSDVALY